ncbi:quaternary amine ABC transporter ATP-binding protein [Clostridium formicaceticum]|uniref:Quaternary amine transport ATP-binding protein n=1 Tax=Clostridium formicaceticum TaxID=1497 RepID=A0AAC9WJ71_9CLOT|nr:glycine betaine/L-proline ABC transporter ATP-binding protein [Clostridium formicaceticum]AOY74824.1 ABC transporter ATP-binding protein [Clostridium formicaceticum]ARE89220.1 Glycine betaine transport ATP-binding protein OpuAA [Clostridium formicaceticum]
MSVQLKVESLIKVFGKNPKIALKKLEKGISKEEILKQTGQAVGVNNVSFEVNKGEIFVIMGLSGSGKSTLIRCLNLLNKPTKGKIYIDGEDIVQYNKQQLRKLRQNKIAMVFQHFGLFSHKSVIENVAYGLEVKDISKQERYKIAEEMLEAVGLGGWGDKMPHQLSGGMQQRVGLARALANDPDILLMDEPFSALDPLIRRDMQLELLDLQAKLQKTIIFITHDVNEAFKIGDRVAVMKDGEVVQIGTPEEILSNPQNGYIEDFIKDIDKSKVVQAKHIMFHPNPLVSMKDGPKVAMKEMKDHGLSSIFVVDKDRKLQGIITIEDTIEAIKENKTLKEILRKDYYTTDQEIYVQELIPKAIDTKYPIAVVDDSEKLLGIIVRVSVLSGLA